MTTTYTTVEKVIQLIRYVDDDGHLKTLTETTNDLKYSQVENYINQAEDFIDAQTNNSWKENTATDELHDMMMPWHQMYSRDTLIKLNHGDVKAFDKTKDHLYIFDGSVETDWLQTKLEGRAKDFYVDYAKGGIYIRNYFYNYRGPNNIRVTYRWGKTPVPKDIEEACTKIVGAKILESDWYHVVLPDGMSSDKGKVAWIWKQDSQKIILNRRRFVVITR